MFVGSRILARAKCVLTVCVSVGMNGTAMPRLPTSALALCHEADRAGSTSAS
jgi:hypothetical protein